MPSSIVVDGSHVTRILREFWRSPAALLGARRNMWKQRQQLKRQSLLEERAHAMRHQPTPSEAKLWEAIRGGQLGVSFKRQVRIGGFIADFLAPAAKLVVEVDGGSHVGRGAADARRDRKLARLGFRVVRVEAETVLRNLPVAVELVLRGLAHEASTLK
jgi:very-short-patch-repair endonuclease